MTIPKSILFPSVILRGKCLQRRSSAPVVLRQATPFFSRRASVAPAWNAAVTLPMCREAPSNFGVKLARPGFGPAAELPTLSPA